MCFGAALASAHSSVKSLPAMAKPYCSFAPNPPQSIVRSGPITPHCNADLCNNMYQIVLESYLEEGHYFLLLIRNWDLLHVILHCSFLLHGFSNLLNIAKPFFFLPCWQWLKVTTLVWWCFRFSRLFSLGSRNICTIWLAASPNMHIQPESLLISFLELMIRWLCLVN